MKLPPVLSYNLETGTAQQILDIIMKRYKHSVVHNNKPKTWDVPYPWLIEKFGNPLYNFNKDGEPSKLLNKNAVWEYLEGYYWFKKSQDAMLFKLVWGEFLNGQS
jgi:hypothetical protein